MLKLKNALITCIGLLTLICLVTLAVPHIGRGASGTSNTAPTSQTQNVNVVNTPMVNAQQTGVWNVGINGTPTVGLDTASNTVRIDSTTPVLVRDVDNPARQPFEASTAIIINDGFFSGEMQLVLTVPAGKVFVLEEVAAEARLSNQKLVDFGVRSVSGPLHRLLLNNQATDSVGKGIFIASQHVRLYFNEGDQVTFHAERNSDVGTIGVDCSISGYFVDK